MKKSGFYILLWLCFLVGACAPQTPHFYEEFQKGESISMERSGLSLFDYNENTCQYSFHADQSLFRVFDDSFTNWLILDCKGAVLKEGANVQADLQWTSPVKVERMNRVNFELVKISNSVYYFWSSQYEIGLRFRAE
ncbi:MAG: hypothetical protein II364_03340 [Bacteroidales bacterium]|nr:hypothetical protein [Bacteroidales bacterium]MBQ1937977.1 hypothetical protein [Bacteroidales bacterium]